MKFASGKSAVGVLSALLWANAVPGQGLFVHEVLPGSSARQEDIRQGDVVEFWRTGDTDSPWRAIRTPFELSVLEARLPILQGVDLQMSRGDDTWVWRTETGALGIVAVPRAAADIAGTLSGPERETDAGDVPALRTFAESGTSDPVAAAWAYSEIFGAAFRTGDFEAGETALQRARQKLKESGFSTAAQQSWLLQRAGEALWQSGSYKEADARLVQARTGLSESSLLAARAQNLRGRVAAYAGRLEEAETLSLEALDVQQSAAAGSLAEAETWHTLGNTAFWSRRIDSAEQRFRRALAIRSEIAADSVDHGRSIGTLGLVAWNRGNLIAAEQHFLDAYAIHNTAQPDSLLAAGDLTMLGHVAYDRRDFQRAENYYFRSLEITQEKYPLEETVANTLMGLGNAARQRFDTNAAIAYHLRAKSIYESLDSRQRLTLVLSNLGNASFDAGDLKAASQYYEQSLALRLELGSSEYSLAPLRYNIAGVAVRENRPDDARALLLQALEQFRQHAPGSLRVQAAVFELGKLEAAANEMALAEAYLTESRKIASALAPGTMYEAEALHALGKLRMRQGASAASKELLSLAIDALESQRGLVGGNVRQHQHFASRFEYLYKDFVGLLIEIDETAAAFEVLEQYRAQVSSAIVRGRARDVRRPLPMPFQVEAEALNQNYDRALSDLMRTSAGDADDLRARRAKLDAASSALAMFNDGYRALHPGQAALESAESIPPDGSRQAIPAGAAVFSYLVTSEHAHLFVANGHSADSIHRVELNTNLEALQDDIAAFTALLRVRTPNQALRTAQQRLSHRLYRQLIAPGRPFLDGVQQLIVLADGPLHGLSFAALGNAEKDGAEARYLIEEFQLKSVPSLTWLSQNSTPVSPAGTPSAVVFADPVSSLIDDGDSADRLGVFRPLPGARREATMIAGLFHNTEVYLGESATEENVKELSGRKLGILHFATHAQVNPQRPMESFLILGRADADGDTGENGLLQAREVVEQLTINADTVVLSACSTAQGQLSAGEGVTGLTSAFLHAGARSVIATQWPVSDNKASSLMQRYYQALLAGESPTAALRQAQVRTIEAGRAERASIRRRLGRFFGLDRRSSDITLADWAAFQLYGGG